MTAIRRNPPIYIVRSDSEDGVYDAAPCPEEDHLGEQLAQTLLGQLMRGLPGSKEITDRMESPATGYSAPGFSQNPSASSQGATGLGAAAAPREARPSSRRSRRMPYFFIFTEAAAGDWICFFHLPRKLLVRIGALLLTLLAGALTIAGVSEGLLNILH